MRQPGERGPWGRNRAPVKRRAGSPVPQRWNLLRTSRDVQSCPSHRKLAGAPPMAAGIWSWPRLAGLFSLLNVLDPWDRSRN